MSVWVHYTEFYNQLRSLTIEVDVIRAFVSSDVDLAHSYYPSDDGTEHVELKLLVVEGTSVVLQ